MAVELGAETRKVYFVEIMQGYLDKYKRKLDDRVYLNFWMIAKMTFLRSWENISSKMSNLPFSIKFSMMK